MNNRACYVYFAPLKNGKRFKIGKSFDPVKRIGELSANNNEEFDGNEVFILEVENDSEAMQIEKVFHIALRKFKVDSKECGFDGREEWFDMKGWKMATDSSKEICNIFGFKKINEKLDFPKNVSQASRVSKDDKHKVFYAIRNLIENERVKSKMTVKEVSDATGMTRSTYYLFLNGENVGVYNLMALFDLFKLSDGLEKYVNDINGY